MLHLRNFIGLKNKDIFLFKDLKGRDFFQILLHFSLVSPIEIVKKMLQFFLM